MFNESIESGLSIASLAQIVEEKEEINDILGFYKLVNEIGHGSFSMVYEAIDTRNNKQVAIKLFNSETGGDGFVREVGLGMELSHPNLLSAIDLGYASDKKRYVVYPLAEGGSLREKIKRSGISHTLVSNYITQIARGLHALHAKSVVHRDLKPENMLFDSEKISSLLRLTDWGTAEIVSKQQAKGEMGSPAYMSPEQINGSCDMRADIYSVGVIAFELLLGRRPFLGAPIDVLRGHLQESPNFNGLSPEMEDVLWKTLAKNPDDRYQTIEDFYFDFEVALLGENLNIEKTFLTDTENIQGEIAFDNLNHWSLKRNDDFVTFVGENTPKIKFEVLGMAQANLSNASLIQFAVRDDVSLFYGFEEKVMQFRSTLYGTPPVVAIRKFNGDVWTINGASNPTLVGRNHQGDIVKEIRLSQNLSDLFSVNLQRREKLLGIDLHRKSLFLFEVDDVKNNIKMVKLEAFIKSVLVSEEKITVETEVGIKHLVYKDFI
jgi:serine/threonine protein kinase